MSVPHTKVLDILDAQHVPYRLLPHREPVFTVEAAAQQRGVVKEEMVKSILLRDRDARYVMACVIGAARVDPHAVRASLPLDWKRLRFATAEEILQVTGFVMGAVAPIGLPPDMPVLFDEAISRCRRVNISSGDPALGLELEPQDLMRIANARLANISEEAP
jgi:prolyl-tRNA editing enzyme YbaK/EbsC (Cys-tRNA(Pro) deacylase)